MPDKKIPPDPPPGAPKIKDEAPMAKPMDGDLPPKGELPPKSGMPGGVGPMMGLPPSGGPQFKDGAPMGKPMAGDLPPKGGSPPKGDLPPKGGMPMGPGPMLGKPPPFMAGGEPQSVPYKKLFRWGWFIVSAAFGWFVLNTLLTVGIEFLTQYNVQVFATIISGLGATTKAGGGEPAASGLLAHFLPQSLESATIVWVVLGLGLILVRLLDRFLTAWTDNTMLGRLQQRLHDKLLSLGPQYHQSHDVGETMLVVTQYSTGAQQLLRDLISSPLVQGVSLVTAVFFLINNLSSIGDTPVWINVVLIAALFVFPVGGWWLSTRVRAAFEKVIESQKELANEFTNSASMPLEVQLMGAEKQRSQAFAGRVATLIRHKVAAAVKREIATQFTVSMPLFLQVVFIFYGVFFAVKSGDPAAAGAVVAIYYFVPQAVGPIQDLIAFINGLNSTWPQVQQVVEILETEPEIQTDSGTQTLGPQDNRLAFENVTFTYAPGAPRILDDFSHVFPKGSVTAIISRQGGGKSTLLNLVARLRDPERGKILLGDKDLKDLKAGSLRTNVVKVSQFPLYLADTIRENMLLAKADATDAELEAVCRQTKLWEVLEDRAPDGGGPLDYRLPRVEGLSGGQRRLLAVARALLLKPVVLILDEPTPNLDAFSLQMLIEVIREVKKDMTVLLVDHNMDFITETADQVCCLENGRFVDSGPTHEVAARPGLFKSLIEAYKDHPAEDEPGPGFAGPEDDLDLKKG